MIKKSLFLWMLFFGLTTCFAQQQIVTASGNTKNNDNSIDYVIGNLYASPIASDGNGSVEITNITTYEIVTLGTDNFTNINLSVTAYPNPTTNMLYLNIGNMDGFTNLTYQLYNVLSKPMGADTITQSKTTVAMQNYATGVYVLAVKSNNKTLKTFKIIKN